MKWIVLKRHNEILYWKTWWKPKTVMFFGTGITTYTIKTCCREKLHTVAQYERNNISVNVIQIIEYVLGSGLIFFKGDLIRTLYWVHLRYISWPRFGSLHQNLAKCDLLSANISSIRSFWTYLRSSIASEVSTLSTDSFYAWDSEL